MVATCVAYGCNNRSKRGGAISFHSFPKDKYKRKLWEVKVRRANFTATEYSKVCSDHFTDDCFETEKFGGTWLKQDAVPTIFDFPKHLYYLKYTATNSSPEEPNEVPAAKDSKEKTCSEDVKLEEPNEVPLTKVCKEELCSEDVEKQLLSLEDCLNPVPTSFDICEVRPSVKREKRLHYLNDFNEEDMHIPAKAIKFLNKAKDFREWKEIKIKLLNHSYALLQKQRASLKAEIQELKWKSLMNILNPASNTYEMNDSDTSASTENMNLCDINDFTEKDMYLQSKSVMLLHIAHKQINEANSKIKSFFIRNRRLKKQIVKLEAEKLKMLNTINSSIEGC